MPVAKEACAFVIALGELDPECAGIDIVANEARETRIDVAASNAFGLGGVNTCLLLKNPRP